MGEGSRELAERLGATAHGRREFRCEPADVEEVCRGLKEEGYRHLTFLTAVDEGDQLEVVYHVQQLSGDSLVLKTYVSGEEPVIDSVTHVWRSADRHEREAYDLFGIEFEGHPNLRSVVLHPDFEGNPLRKDYEDRGQDWSDLDLTPIDPGDFEEKEPEDREVMYINMGPQHPSAHGVARIQVQLDQEVVQSVNLGTGFMHRGVEKLCEDLGFKSIPPLYNRFDWAGPAVAEGAFIRPVEEMLEIEAPTRAQYLRVVSSELGRITSHLLAVGTTAMDLAGVTGVVNQYCWRDREKGLELLDRLTGARITHNYMTIGGVRHDLPDRFRDHFDQFHEELLDGIQEISDLTLGNEVFRVRTVGTGVIEGERMLDWGVTGPSLRASGVNYDIRDVDPYFAYEDLDFDVVTDDGSDNRARFEVRLEEMRVSARLIQQVLDEIPGGDIQTEVPRRLKARGEHFSSVESSKGEFGTYIVAKESNKPYRFKVRAPSFSNLGCLNDMVKGEKLPDLVAGFSSLDPVFGEVDR